MVWKWGNVSKLLVAKTIANWLIFWGETLLVWSCRSSSWFNSIMKNIWIFSLFHHLAISLLNLPEIKFNNDRYPSSTSLLHFVELVVFKLSKQCVRSGHSDRYVPCLVCREWGYVIISTYQPSSADYIQNYMIN
jgi:hypothetical protein